MLLVEALMHVLKGAMIGSVLGATSEALLVGLLVRFARLLVIGTMLPMIAIVLAIMGEDWHGRGDENDRGGEDDSTHDNDSLMLDDSPSVGVGE